MAGGDFFENERSVVMDDATEVRIEHVGADGSVTALRAPIAIEAGEVIDATFLSARALVEFLDAQIADARDQGVLFSFT